MARPAFQVAAATSEVLDHVKRCLELAEAAGQEIVWTSYGDNYGGRVIDIQVLPNKPAGGGE
jgi:hypothetical protein